MRQEILAPGILTAFLVVGCSSPSTPPSTAAADVADSHEATAAAEVEAAVKPERTTPEPLLYDFGTGNRKFFDDGRPVTFPGTSDDSALSWAREHHNRVYKEYAALSAEHRRLRGEVRDLRARASELLRQGRTDEARAYKINARQCEIEAARLKERLDPMREEARKAAAAVQEINDRNADEDARDG